MRQYNGPYRGHGIGASVPRDVALKIARERDALAAELERTRAQLARLSQQHQVHAERSVDPQEVRAMREAFSQERTQWAHERAELEDALEEVKHLQQEAQVAMSQAQHDAQESLRAQERLTQQAAQAQGLSGDLDRIRRRQSEDIQQATQRATRDTLSEFLELRDGLSMAHQYADPDNPWTQGIEQLIQQFDRIVTRLGLTLIGQVGERFDPNQHEAVSTQEGDDPDLIAVVERPGYAFEDGTIARPARVVVTR